MKFAVSVPARSQTELINFKQCRSCVCLCLFLFARTYFMSLSFDNTRIYIHTHSILKK